MKLLLLGANGQLGQKLGRTLPKVGEVCACARSEVDLTNAQSILDIIGAFKPDIIVNAAAYTAVDKAESERELTFCINADAVCILANEAAKRDIWLIHYSTDYIFDGQKETAYTEDDATGPVNAYGESKLAGEQTITASGCKHLIFRTSWVIGKDGTNFAKTILRLASERENLSVIDDQFGVPSSPALISKVTADAIDAISKDKAWPTGIYHLAPKGETTWFGVAQALLKHAGNSDIELSTNASQLKAISTSEYPTVAKRPLNSRLNTDKLAQHLSFTLPDWKEDFSVTAKSIIKEVETA